MSFVNLVGELGDDDRVVIIVIFLVLEVSACSDVDAILFCGVGV